MKENVPTNLTVEFPDVCQCTLMGWTTEVASTHVKQLNHTQKDALLTFDLCSRSALCCSTSSLTRARSPPTAANRTAVLPNCEHENDEIDK